MAVNPAPPLGRSLVEYIDDHLDKTLDRLDRSWEPIWQAQNEMGRTLITLSSASLVLSISVIQTFAGKIENAEWSWLLPSAWGLFGLVVLVGAVRYSWAGSARSARVLFEHQRSSIRSQLWDLTAGPEFATQVDAILEKAMATAQVRPARAAKVHDAMNHVMFWSFALGLGGLIAFAAKNLPF